MSADLIERLRGHLYSCSNGDCELCEDIRETVDEIERLRREMLAVQDRANANSDACKSCRSIEGMTRAALTPETDDGPCTDCDDTGWMYQTERQCTCGAKP